MNPKAFRRFLRKHSTSGENSMWRLLRNRNFMNLKFRRQYTIDRYTVDFYCPSLNLVIEVDGTSHDNAGQQEYDNFRNEQLRAKGYTIYRVENDAVVNFHETVLEDLKNFIRLLPSS